MDFLGFDGQKGQIRDFTVCSIHCVYRAEWKWQIVYLSSKETITIFTSFSIQKVAHPSGINLQLGAETCKFSQVPSLFMGH